LWGLCKTDSVVGDRGLRRVVASPIKPIENRSARRSIGHWGKVASAHKRREQLARIALLALVLVRAIPARMNLNKTGGGTGASAITGPIRRHAILAGW
jgi:hypothetical protein